MDSERKSIAAKAVDATAAIIRRLIAACWRADNDDKERKADGV